MAAGQDRRIADRYRLTGVIGSGGAGTVWTAVDEVLGREVAIKDVVIPPWLNEHEREIARQRTMREARAACRIDHPNVVDIYDVVEDDDRPWIVMQLVKAPSLATLIEQEGPCSPGRAARIGLQLLNALRAVHAQGITHRDVKPSNVLVAGDHVLLTDFGIATINGESTLTSPDTLVGAPSYIAPERVSGQPATAASDLWSLGATLYATVEGRPPHVREGVIAILTAVATDEPDPTIRAGALAPLLAALLRKDPQLRPDAAQVEQALHRVISLTDDEPTSAHDPTDLAALTGRNGRTGPIVTTGSGAKPSLGHGTTAPLPVIRRRRRPLLASAAALAVLAALATVLILQPGRLPGVPNEQPVNGGEPSGINPAPATSEPISARDGSPAGSSSSSATTGTSAAEPVDNQPAPTSDPPASMSDAPTATPEPTQTSATVSEPPPTSQETPASTAASEGGEPPPDDS